MKSLFDELIFYENNEIFSTSRLERDTRWQGPFKAKDAEENAPKVAPEEPARDVGQRRVDVRRHHDDADDDGVAERRRNVAGDVAAREICIQSADATDGAEIPRQE